MAPRSSVCPVFSVLGCVVGLTVGDSLLAGELRGGGARHPRGDGVAQEDRDGLHEREGHGPQGVLRGHGYASSRIIVSASDRICSLPFLSFAGLNAVVTLDAQAGGKAFEQV